MGRHTAAVYHTIIHNATVFEIYLLRFANMKRSSLKSGYSYGQTALRSIPACFIGA